MGPYPSHWTSFRQGAFTGVGGAGIAEISEALSGDVARVSQAALGHAADLAQMVYTFAAYLI